MMSLIVQDHFNCPCFLFFLMKLNLVFSRLVRNCVGVLMEIESLDCFCIMATYIRLILPNHEYERSIFCNILKYFPSLSLTIYHTSLSRAWLTAALRHFILFMAIMNSAVSLIYFSASLSFVYKMATDTHRHKHTQTHSQPYISS